MDDKLHPTMGGYPCTHGQLTHGTGQMPSWYRRNLAPALCKMGSQSCRTKVTEACGLDQICAGLEAGIEGTVHTVCAMNVINQEDDNEEEWES